MRSLLYRSTISVIIALFLLLISGCSFNSVFINYPSQIAPLKYALNQQTAPSLTTITEEIDSADGLLYAQEAGRAAQITGSFEQSKDYYAHAIAAYNHFDDKALISASQIGATASSMMLNDNAIPYRGSGYERIILHQYQALNYLFNGELSSALVEVRRSNELQQLEQQRYEKASAEVKAMANGAVDSEIRRLSQDSKGTSNSFLNAYSYYTTALLHELLAQPNDAFIDYRKAAQIMPNNPYIQQDLVRLAKQLNMPQAKEFEQKWGTPPQQNSNQGQVVFFIERYFVAEKQSFTVPFRIDGNWQAASLATYAPRAKNAAPPLLIKGFTEKPFTASTIVNIDTLAITALKEELPAALVRQAGRIYTKAEMAKRVDGDHNGYYNDSVGSIAIQLFNVVSEQADRRSWLTLPQEALIARRYSDVGTYSISLNNSASLNVVVKPKKTTLVWVIDTGNMLRFYSTII